MPLIVLNEDQKKAAVQNVDSDLKWILADNGVANDTQEVLFHLNVKKMKVFAGVAPDEGDLRTLLKDEVGLDPTTSMAERTQVAMVVIAWKAAQTYVKKEDERSAEARTSDIPKQVSMIDLKAMRTAFEAAHGKLQKLEFGALLL